MAEYFGRPAHWFRCNDPDETEGRRIYRAQAERDGTRSIAMTRKVRYLLTSSLEPLPMTTNNTQADALEIHAKAIWAEMLRNGLANDVREWDRREWKDGDWDCHIPALDDKTKAKVRAIAALRQTPAGEGERK